MSDQWQGCYDDGWQGDIVPDAFSHPAKFSRGLIHRIYKHAKEEGWINEASGGDWILDPFGGVALGGLDAYAMGLNWVGVELEEKFVKLGQQNIDLWTRQLKGWPNLGTAKIVQGDSRDLGGVIEKAGLIVSSPPFVDQEGSHSAKKFSDPEGSAERRAEGYRSGRLKGHFASKEAILKSMQKANEQNYGHTPGNLANMKEGDVTAVIGSPPYADLGESTKGHGIKGAKGSIGHGCKADTAEYGSTPGQLGSLREGVFDAVVSSPPYEAQMNQGGAGTSKIVQKIAVQTHRDPNKPSRKVMSQSKQWPESKGQLGNSSGDTFWSASREIVQGCYDLLRDGGHAIWVTKRYVKAGKIVEFSDRWQALCESVGFRLVCRHQAMLVKNHGIQTTTYGDKEITTERKSFFRRLAEKKGSPRIDWEDVICMVTP